MQIASTELSTTAIANQPANTTQKANALGYDAFLQLMIAQLKNQDPTEPLDASQYVSQLASFSGVEQAVKTNAKLDALLSSFSFQQADGLIGKYVQSADKATAGEVEAVRITSSGAVAILTSGKELKIDAGLTIRNDAPTAPSA